MLKLREKVGDFEFFLNSFSSFSAAFLVSLVGKAPFYCARCLGSIPRRANNQGPDFSIIEEKVLSLPYHLQPVKPLRLLELGR